ncbi:PhzF family phenazine biosynthesis protein [Brachybacterium sp. DNPG3]
MTPSTPRSRAFAQVDVFTAVPFGGNPLAVVLDADGLDDAAMQAIARWTNLSETTFVLPPTQPGADYRVRILTPTGELDFAGHPTLGTAAAWLAAHDGDPADGDPADGDPADGRADGRDAAPGRRIVQECGIGLVEVRVEQGTFAFAAPPLRRTGPLDPEHLWLAADALGIAPAAILDHAWVDNGAGWYVVELASAEEVLALEPDLARLPGRKLGAIGVVGAASGVTGGAASGAHEDAPAYEVRGFVASDPDSGTPGFEDPVTGSLNAGIAQWMLERRARTPPWTVSQGTRLGRSGRVRIDVDSTDADSTGTVWIGGETTVRISGRIVV